MQIARVDCLAADAGWRVHDFVKVTLADGQVGWSEFSRAFGVPGVCEAVVEISARLIGLHPQSNLTDQILSDAAHRWAPGYLARGALQNALLDVQARALGVPVHALLGDRVRQRVRLYWAHCGTYRASHAEIMARPCVAELEDLVRLGHEVVDRGYTALKTNLLLFCEGRARRYVSTRPVAEARLRGAIEDQLAALREGGGATVDIMLDVGSNFAPDQVIDVARFIEPFTPTWLEVALNDPAKLRYISERSTVPIAGGERAHVDDYPELLRGATLHIPIVDLLSNGVAQSIDIAAACAAVGKPIAVHNCYSPLATMMAAAFCAVVPNLHILEHDVDAVPWDLDFVTRSPRIDSGYLELVEGPGWGTEVNEEAVRAHPVEAAQ